MLKRVATDEFAGHPRGVWRASFLHPPIAAKLIEDYVRRVLRRGRPGPADAREREVLTLIAEGNSNRDRRPPVPAARRSKAIALNIMRWTHRSPSSSYARATAQQVDRFSEPRVAALRRFSSPSSARCTPARGAASEPGAAGRRARPNGLHRASSSLCCIRRFRVRAPATVPFGSWERVIRLCSAVVRRRRSSMVPPPVSAG